MAESLVVSPVNCRTRARNAFLRIKSCSPKFKTALRQRYKERVKNSRSRLLDKFRHLDNNGDSLDKLEEPEDCFYLEFEVPKSQLLAEILQDNGDFDLDEELLFEDDSKEELSQFENWLLQEYEAILNDEENDEITVTCPLCCSGYFKSTGANDNKIFCTNCGLSLKTERSMLEIQNDIFNDLDRHKLTCHADPAFVSVPIDGTFSNLCIVCDICSYLQVII